VKSLRTSKVLNTATLMPTPDVVLPQGDPDTVLALRLAGPLAGYTWPINGKLYDPPNDGIAVDEGKRVRLRFANDSMMFHPMHLHGHTFQGRPAGRSWAAQGHGTGPADDDPSRWTSTPNNPGKWIVHCHNEYYPESAMATFVEYTG
jgi:FtsP/CotA-like multicopper oxidase with cupredoxin domain